MVETRLRLYLGPQDYVIIFFLQERTFCSEKHHETINFILLEQSIIILQLIGEFPERNSFSKNSMRYIIYGYVTPFCFVVGIPLITSETAYSRTTYLEKTSKIQEMKV